MSNDTGGPAFPTILYENGGCTDGMDLRDYFAAKVLQGQLASGTLIYSSDDLFNKLARSSYAMADAMLEARK